MTLARTHAVALLGVEGHVIEVEADLGNGIPGLSIIGLPDTSLYEARDRVKAAIVNSGEAWPQRRITLGLSPASLRKTGSSFDLADVYIVHTSGHERNHLRQNQRRPGGRRPRGSASGG